MSINNAFQFWYLSPVSFSKQPSIKLNSFYCGGGTQTQKTTWCSSSMRWFIGKASMKWGHIAIVIIYPTSKPTVVTRLTNHLKLCLFCSSSLPIYYYCTERIFTQKALFTVQNITECSYGTRSFVPVRRLEIRFWSLKWPKLELLYSLNIFLL